MPMRHFIWGDEYALFQISPLAHAFYDDSYPTDGLLWYDKTTIIIAFSYREAPATDTSIASSCWANTRRGCHRLCLIISQRATRPHLVSSFAKEAAFISVSTNTLVPFHSFFFERNEIFELARIIWESSNYSYGIIKWKILVDQISLARWILAVNILWQTR